MNLYKLSAITSTNDYLKELLTKKSLNNYTVVSAEFQTLGRGQSSNKWVSENGKNLLISILLIFENVRVDKNAYLNFAISLGIYKVLSNYISNLSIKWPNDIMAGNKKISGVLIENSVRDVFIKHCIVGIGININQEVFPDNINAISLKNVLNKDMDKDLLLIELVASIKIQIQKLEEKKFDELKNNYENVLFKKGIPSMFKTLKEGVFMGKIIEINTLGMLIIELNNGTLKSFMNKEVTYI